MLWSTSPTNRAERGEAAKKDITLMQNSTQRSRVFKPYSKTIAPPLHIYNSKVHLDAKKGRFIPGLQEKSQRMLTIPSPRESRLE